MKKRSGLRRGISLLLLVSLLLSLCGCGGRRSGDTQMEQTEPAAEAPAASAETSAMQDDTVIRDHMRGNQALREWEEAVRSAEEFHLYVANTETMAGYLLGMKVTEFQQTLQSVYDTANSYYDTLTAHYLTHEPGYEDVQWTQKELTTITMRNLLADRYYVGNELPAAGPMTTMFDGETSPFLEKGVTAILTNFVEPAFDLNALAEGIESYFDAYENSAACVVGLHNTFDAEAFNTQTEKEAMKLYFTSEIRGDADLTNYIDCFTGKAPFYVVLVGPEGAVQTFSEDLFQRLDGRNVEYSSSTYTNNAYKDIRSEPLNFDLLPDQKARKVPAQILSSYNTGNMTWDEDSNAFFATYVGVESAGSTDVPRGVTEEEKEDLLAQAESIRYSSQIALLTSGYDGSTPYAWEDSLYIYDQQTRTWVDAGKNAASMVTIAAEVWDSEVSETINDRANVLLTGGREEIYLSAKLDFSDESILSRDKIYRLEVRLLLNRENPAAHRNEGAEALERYSIGSADYYNYVNQISALSKGNYRWSGTFRGDRNKVADALSRTPNLSTFLNRLEQIEQKYQDDQDVIQYLDLVFNLPDAESKRR